MSDDYRVVNRHAWDAFARSGMIGTRPPEDWAFEQPRIWLDERGWLPWADLRTVLCLAAGGGAQGPLFASLGLGVTVADISPDQLATDRRIAKDHGLQLETIDVDVQDLSPLYGRDFDLVYQPISSLYIPDIRAAYREVARVLPAGGLYLVEHWNPVQMQLSGERPWDGGAYRLEHRQDGCPIAWSHPLPDGGSATSWNYIHSLGALIGGLCEAGFTIVRFGERGHGSDTGEPGSTEHVARYVPSFFATLAIAPG